MPTVDPKVAKQTFDSLHRAIDAGLVRSCHDLSEGGMAVALTEMAFAGGYGASVQLADGVAPEISLYSESNTRFVCEVTPENAAKFEQTLAGTPLTRIGTVTDGGRVTIKMGGQLVVDADLETLKEAWQAPFRW